VKEGRFILLPPERARPGRSNVRSPTDVKSAQNIPPELRSSRREEAHFNSPLRPRPGRRLHPIKGWFLKPTNLFFLARLCNRPGIVVSRRNIPPLLRERAGVRADVPLPAGPILRFVGSNAGRPGSHLIIPIAHRLVHCCARGRARSGDSAYVPIHLGSESRREGGAGVRACGLGRRPAAMGSDSNKHAARRCGKPQPRTAALRRLPGARICYRVEVGVAYGTLVSTGAGYWRYPARQVVGRPADWEIGDTADWEVCATF